MEEGFPENVAQPGPARAMRLIFEYEGDKVRLISQTAVDMALTGSDITHTEQAAYFVDSRDAADRTLARVSAHGAFASSTEVFPEQHGSPITRVDITHPKGAFTVIAPAPEDIHHVTVLKVSQKPPTAAGEDHGVGPKVIAPQIQDLASFPITFESTPKKEGEKQ